MTTTQADALPELLREIVAYCREAGHDWSSLTEAEHHLAALQSQPAAAGLSDAEILVVAEFVGLIGPRSRVGESHDAAVRFARAILALRPQAVPMIPRGFTVHHQADWPALTDEANARNRWRVERNDSPYAAPDGTRAWAARTLEDALSIACSDLGITAHGAQGGEG